MIKDEINPAIALSEFQIDLHDRTRDITCGVNPYIAAATSNNTRKAYRSDVRHYERFGGLLPASPESVISYIRAFATRLNSRTLNRRLIALRHWHTYQGFIDPTSNSLVKKTMLGITRTHGKPKDKAPPLTPEDLQSMISKLRKNTSLASVRDNALLQIGFFGALRRSELVNIHFEHITWKEEGIEILLPFSKTDQLHEGQCCAIPYGNELLCPVTALENWLNQSGIKEGAIFRRVSHNKLTGISALTALSVNHIIKHRALEANISNANELSAHSLRRGLATSAARMGTPLQTIMRTGRWKQTNTVMEYIEASERFSDSAASNILSTIVK